MRVAFGFALTAGGIAILAWLTFRRDQVARAFGGSGMAMAMIGFALVANLAPLAGEDLSSPIIGLSVLGLLGWAGAVWFRSGKPRSVGPADVWLRISWFAIGILLVWSTAVDIFTGSGIYGARPVAYASSALLWLALGLIASHTAITMLATAYWGLVILAVLSIPALFDSGSWRACTTGALEKCSLADGLYKSIYDSENYIAIVASVALIACWCSMRRLELLAAVSFCLLIIVATGSRTSLLAVAAAGGWRLAAFLLERRRQYFRIPLAIGVMVTSLSVGIATYLMFTASKTTLSNRGNIWKAAREYLADRVYTGVGVSKWYMVRDAGEAPHHFFHSTYVLVIFAGGFIGITIWGLWVTALLRGVVTDGQAFTAKTPVILLLVYSLTEVIWNPLSVDGLSWILIAIMLTMRIRPSAEDDPAQGPHQPGKVSRFLV